jgi:membrane protease YdiL (CAAX protease family)
MEQFTRFCRSLIPTDPFQALFLSGAVLISFSRQLGWYSRPIILKYTQDTSVSHNFANFMIIAVLPTLFAGCAGYFVCFWPGKHPVRRTAVAVLLPVLAGLILVFLNYASLAAPSRVSVLYGQKSDLTGVAAMAGEWRLFPTAFYACLLGAIFVFLFLLRLANGKSALPLRFLASYAKVGLGPELSKRTCILIFAIPALAFFANCISYVFGAWSLPHGPSPISDALSKLSGATQASFLAVVAFLIVGSVGLKFLRQVLQLPTPRFLGWACGIGVVLGFVVPVLHYLFERSHWAAFDFGKTSPPQFSDVTLHKSWLAAIGLIVVAICVEIVMRGLLQPKLLDRFGIHRGIVFTAAIWGAYEFHLYNFARYSVPDLLVTVGVFFGTHLTLSYLYAWAYLKSGSIVPTIALHAILSLSTLFKIELDFPGARYARLVVWVVGTLLLFRIWPLTRQIAPEVDMPRPDPTPAM